MPKNASMEATTVSTLVASATPPAIPTSVPSTPIRVPWTMKMRMMRPGDAPSVRRMAMSASLSVTTMISVETMLKAATATISVRITNITVFSVFRARKKLAWCWVQSRIQNPPPRLRARSRAMRGARG